jgi:hypothetical protein
MPNQLEGSFSGGQDRSIIALTGMLALAPQWFGRLNPRLHVS